MKKQNMIRKIFMTALLLGSFAFFGGRANDPRQPGTARDSRAPAIFPARCPVTGVGDEPSY